jgi:hypothetical protein
MGYCADLLRLGWDWEIAARRHPRPPLFTRMLQKEDSRYLEQVDLAPRPAKELTRAKQIGGGGYGRFDGIHKLFQTMPGSPPLVLGGRQGESGPGDSGAIQDQISGSAQGESRPVCMNPAVVYGNGYSRPRGIGNHPFGA